MEPAWCEPAVVVLPPPAHPRSQPLDLVAAPQVAMSATLSSHPTTHNQHQQQQHQHRQQQHQQQQQQPPPPLQAGSCGCVCVGGGGRVMGSCHARPSLDLAPREGVDEQRRARVGCQWHIYWQTDQQPGPMPQNMRRGSRIHDAAIRMGPRSALGPGNVMVMLHPRRAVMVQKGPKGSKRGPRRLLDLGRRRAAGRREAGRGGRSSGRRSDGASPRAAENTPVFCYEPS